MSTIDRREFMRWTGVGAGAAVLGSLVPLPFRRLGAAEAAELADYSRGTWIPSCCNMCGGQCGTMAFVQDGQPRPAFFVCAEKNRPGSDAAFRLRVVNAARSEVVEQSDALGDLDAFAEAGLRLGTSALGLGNEPVARML